MEKHHITKYCIIFALIIYQSVSWAQSYQLGSDTMLTYKVKMDARIKPKHIAEIACSIGGQVTEQYVPFGQHVDKDQNLFKASAKELQAQYLTAKANFLEQYAQFKQLKNWQESVPVQQALGHVNRAKKMLSNAQDKYKHSKTLFEQGIISAQECTQDKFNYENAVEHLRAMQQTLMMTEQRGQVENIKVQYLKTLQLKKQLQALQDKIKKTTITSPISGKFVRANLPSQQKYWHRQTLPFTCQENDVLGYVFSEDQFQVLAFGDESTMLDIQPGTLANIEIQKKQFEASVQEINTIPEYNKKNKNEVEIVLEFMDPPKHDALPLVPNMQVVVNIDIKKPTNGLLVPILYLANDHNGFYVLKQNTGEAPSRVYAKIGASDHLYAQIDANLKVGDTILAPHSA